MYASCTLGTSCSRRLSAPTTAVTLVNGRRREPYPPATVSFDTTPSRAGKSTNRARMKTPPDHTECSAATDPRRAVFRALRVFRGEFFSLSLSLSL